jgi:hypothetical protein
MSRHNNTKSKSCPLPGYTNISLFNKYLHAAFQYLLTLCLLLSLLNCGGGGGGSPAGTTDDTTPDTPPDTAPYVVGLQISPVMISLITGTETNGSATAIYSDNSKRDVTEEVSWSVLSDAIATVSNDSGNKGVIRGQSQGSTQVSASLGDINATTTITVANAELVSLSIDPQSSALPSGTSISLQATGHYSNGSSQDLTATLQWESDAPNIASVDDNGVVTGGAVGSAVISASLAGLSANAEVTVSDAILQNITINPAQLSLAVGTELDIHAQGQFSDGSIRDITQSVNWQSSDLQVATLTDNSQQFSLHGESTGSATLSAELTGITVQQNIVVTEAILQSLSIVSEATTIALGNSMQFTAIATFSDYSTQDLTEQVAWSSDQPSVLSVSNATGEAGLGTPLAPGTVTVSIGFDDLAASKTISVTDAQLLSINLDPISPGIAAGTQLQLSASGNYSDGSSRDISALVSWSSTKETIASVGNVDNQYGLAEAIAPGAVTITAVLGDIVGSTQMTVTDAVLQSIAIQPEPLSLAKGTTVQLRVIGQFNDATTQDLTNQVYWSSSDPDVAAVSNLANGQGFTQSVAVGSTTITAQLINDDSVQSSASLTVTDAILQSLSITPQNAQLSNNTTLQYSATGHFSDGSTQDLTEAVTWSASDEQLATISNATGNGRHKGLALGIRSQASGSGSTTITATINVNNEIIEATTDLTVDYVPDKPIAVVATASPNVILNDGLDATTISLDVKAASQGFTVPDSTIVDITITEGSALLSDDSVTTVNGEAQITLTSDTEGFIVLTASVRGSDVTNHTVILSTPSFANVFGEIALAQVNVDGTTVLADSKLVYFIFNFSNREFTINEFNFYANDVPDPAYQDLTTVPLSGGQIFGRGIIFDQDVQQASSFSLEFVLNEPISPSDFSLSAFYALQ